MFGILAFYIQNHCPPYANYKLDHNL